jgi:hypothetical protein
MLRVGAWILGAVLAFGSAGPVSAEDTKEELKQLDKLQGYDQLREEKSVKKDMLNVPKQPIETIIVWSEAKPTSGAAPLKVTFVADPPADVTDAFYSWDFGDGSAPITGQSVSHTYAKPGIYRVLLKVANTAGTLGQDELRIKVTP